MLRDKRITNLPYHSFTRVSTSTHNAQPITPETPHNIFAIISIQWKMRSGTDRSTKRNDVILCGLLAQTECAVNIRMLTMCFAFSCNRDFPENLESGHTTHPTSVCMCVCVREYRVLSQVSVCTVPVLLLLLLLLCYYWQRFLHMPYAFQCAPPITLTILLPQHTSSHRISSHFDLVMRSEWYSSSSSISSGSNSGSCIQRTIHDSNRLARVLSFRIECADASIDVSSFKCRWRAPRAVWNSNFVSVLCVCVYVLCFMGKSLHAVRKKVKMLHVFAHLNLFIINIIITVITHASCSIFHSSFRDFDDDFFCCFSPFSFTLRELMIHFRCYSVWRS